MVLLSSIAVAAVDQDSLGKVFQQAGGADSYSSFFCSWWWWWFLLLLFWSGRLVISWHHYRSDRDIDHRGYITNISWTTTIPDDLENYHHKRNTGWEHSECKDITAVRWNYSQSG
jgi:hypothetical protein